MQVTSGDADTVAEAAALSAASPLFRGLGDPTRLAVPRHPALGEGRVVDLTAHLGPAQPMLSEHLLGGADDR